MKLQDVITHPYINFNAVVSKRIPQNENGYTYLSITHNKMQYIS